MNWLISKFIKVSSLFILHWIIWDIKSSKECTTFKFWWSVLVFRLDLAAKPSSYFATWFQKMPKNRISQIKKFSWLFWILFALNSDRYLKIEMILCSEFRFRPETQSVSAETETLPKPRDSAETWVSVSVSVVH